MAPPQGAEPGPPPPATPAVESERLVIKGKLRRHRSARRSAPASGCGPGRGRARPTRPIAAVAAAQQRRGPPRAIDSAPSPAVTGALAAEDAGLQGFPIGRPGMAIGLLGGSFDPPHAGHLHITRWALRAFRLDRVWWLVSPGNPLKPEAPADLDRRLAAARRLVRHPRIVVTGVEARLGTRLTVETLAALRRRYPGVRFVWLMGADNLVGFHRWDRWDEIMATTPVGVLARPGQQLRAGLSPAARRYARWRLPASQAGALARTQPPVWTLLSGRMLDLSSSELRALGAWRR